MSDFSSDYPSALDFRVESYPRISINTSIYPEKSKVYKLHWNPFPGDGKSLFVSYRSQQLQKVSYSLFKGERDKLSLAMCQLCSSGWFIGMHIKHFWGMDIFHEKSNLAMSPEYFVTRKKWSRIWSIILEHFHQFGLYLYTKWEWALFCVS